jgi:N-acetylmuramoyl-L-alanine amidase
MIIALFPGHFGKDAGAVVTAPINLVEAAITAGITSKCHLLLQLMGIECIIAGGSWDYRIAASQGCTCGVDIHADISKDKTVHGYHCIHYPNSSKGKELAQKIDKAMILIAQRARMVHGEDLHILRETSFPVALVECGFLSNETDQGLLSNDEYQYQIAFSIVQGVREFIYKA